MHSDAFACIVTLDDHSLVLVSVPPLVHVTFSSLVHVSFPPDGDDLTV